MGIKLEIPERKLKGFEQVFAQQAIFIEIQSIQYPSGFGILDLIKCNK